MDKLDFRVDYYTGWDLRTEIYVNGKKLYELIAPKCRGFCSTLDPGWLYIELIGLGTYRYERLSCDFYFRIIYYCACGCLGCDDIRIKVVYKKDTVIWEIEGDYLQLLEFDKTEYKNALEYLKTLYNDVRKRKTRLDGINPINNQNNIKYRGRLIAEFRYRHIDRDRVLQYENYDVNMLRKKN